LGCGGRPALLAGDPWQLAVGDPPAAASDGPPAAVQPPAVDLTEREMESE